LRNLRATEAFSAKILTKPLISDAFFKADGAFSMMLGSGTLLAKSNCFNAFDDIVQTEV
jgi:hypothetical protein